MDNITVVFVAFEAFNTRGFSHISKLSTGSSVTDLIVEEDKERKGGQIHSLFNDGSENAPFVFD